MATNKICALIALISLLANNLAQAQTLAYQTPATTQQPPFSSLAFSKHKGNDKFSNLTKTGTLLSGGGILVGLLGLAMAESAPNNVDGVGQQIEGAFIFLVGGVVGITGGALSLAGLIKDHHHHHRHSLSLTTPKSNQVGIAYNF